MDPATIAALVSAGCAVLFGLAMCLKKYNLTSSFHKKEIQLPLT